MMGVRGGAHHMMGDMGGGAHHMMRGGGGGAHRVPHGLQLMATFGLWLK